MPAARSAAPLTLLAALTLPVVVVAAASCGSSPPEGAAAAGEEIRCPSPVGRIKRESCAAVADDFAAISVSGALKNAGSSPDAERRTAAIRAVDDLAKALKSERVALCEQHNACKVTQKDHAERDRILADIMESLVKLWDSRKLTDTASFDRFHQEVLALHKHLDPSAGKAPPGATASAAPAESALRIDADKLATIESAAVTFKTERGAVTVTVKDDASHDVLRGAPDQVKLQGGKRYLIKISGSYTPASQPLLAPGDDVTVRVKYRAAEAAELYAALRSLEDPDSTEATTTWKLAAGEKGSKEAALTAPAGASGPYLGLGVSGTATLEIDDIELLRGGKVLAAARAEAASEPHVKTSCATSTAPKPIAGKKSLRCGGGAGDKLTLGLPPSHLFVAVRSPSGERAVLRTLSLEGGRSLDATLTEGGEIVVGLAGPGTATLRSIEITPVAK